MGHEATVFLSNASCHSLTAARLEPGFVARSCFPMSAAFRSRFTPHPKAWAGGIPRAAGGAAPKSRAADMAQHDRATNSPYCATVNSCFRSKNIGPTIWLRPCRIALPTLRRAGRLHAANGAETSSLALRLTSSPRQGFVSGIIPAHACRAACRKGNPQGEPFQCTRSARLAPALRRKLKCAPSDALPRSP